MPESQLFDIPAVNSRPARGAAVYVCPQCWRRAELLIATEEAPFCERCQQRMSPLPPADVRRTARPAEEQLSLWE